jgi:ATP-binding cassette subfamily B protein
MFKFIPQQDQMDCGPACLAMVASTYGKNYSLQYLRDYSFITREGVSMLGISEAAQKIGFETLSMLSTLEELQEFPMPCILHWNQNHFIVLTAIKEKKRVAFNPFRKAGRWFKIADPAHGLIELHEEDFKKSWRSKDDRGSTLLLDPTAEFYQLKDAPVENKSFGFLSNLMKPYKKEVLQLLAGLLAGNLFTFIFPFLTQALIDKGVMLKNLNNVLILLLAQIFLFMGSISIEIVRNWILLYLGTRLNISIISEFLRKILRLPIRFFDTKMMGDFNQRIQDHERIENFLTSQSLVTLFSIINFSVFFVVLFYYNVGIVIAYALLTIMAVTWSLIFMRKRKILDYYRFQHKSENQESVYELINGIQEIKLNCFEDYKRNQWEKIQVKLYKVNLRILKINQVQYTGFDFINQLKNIVVTFIATREVILGNISLGEMLAVSYIIGQMNSPMNQLLNFFRSLQDAKLSLSRLTEVQSHQDEDRESDTMLTPEDLKKSNVQHKGLVISSIGFQYEGPKSPFVLEDISLWIPEGKTTAIVGASGSGKTTLMKLLLKFYEPTTGNICVNNHDLSTISSASWRGNCGVVMQDGFIFSDSIERNIVTGDNIVNQRRLDSAIKTANLQDFIDSLPLGLQTKIGAAGNGISGGQKQRILIARSVYKNPHYIFFDEATSALDAENERIIHDNLQGFFKGKTVIIIAHRLSTVKNADQVIVLKNGRVVEIGTHQILLGFKQHYYNLVKNQLELGA